MAKEKSNEGVYVISENVTNIGYKGKIDNKLFIVNPNIYRKGYKTSELIKPASTEQQTGFDPEKGTPVMKKNDECVFTNLSDNELWILVNAGVVTLSEEQDKVFHAKHYPAK